MYVRSDAADIDSWVEGLGAPPRPPTPVKDEATCKVRSNDTMGIRNFMVHFALIVDPPMKNEA